MKMYEQIASDVAKAVEEFAPNASFEKKMSYATRMGAQIALNSYHDVLAHDLANSDSETLTIANRTEVQAMALNMFNTLYEIMFEDESDFEGNVEEMIETLKNMDE